MCIEMEGHISIQHIIPFWLWEIAILSKDVLFMHEIPPLPRIPNNTKGRGMGMITVDDVDSDD